MAIFLHGFWLVGGFAVSQVEDVIKLSLVNNYFDRESNLLHKSHNAPVPYLVIHRFVT